MLKKYEQELLKDDWHTIRDGLEVKLCQPPHSEEADEQPADAAAEQETFILCRSRDRYEKDAAILRRFEEKIEERLRSMAARCAKQKRDPMKVEREVGRLLGQNTRAAKLFEVTVESTDEGHARVKWKKLEAIRDWATLSAGCYLLRTNVRDWTDEELWKTYIQLTEAEAAFRIQKSDLSLRPIWHQKQDRVLAHILVCFLAYVLWKMLGQLCERAGLGNEPRRVLDELSELRTVDVILPTSEGTEIRKRCVAKPSEHQAILIDRLGLALPSHLRMFEFEM
jgi:transposase